MDAINAHDVDRIVSLMADDHIFMDAYGHSEGKEAMAQGWPGYFMWFPDYLIEVHHVFVSDDMVGIFGYASGTCRGGATPHHANHWRIPAAWRAVVKNHKIAVWQVYADSKIPFDIMSESNKIQHSSTQQ